MNEAALRSATASWLSATRFSVVFTTCSGGPSSCTRANGTSSAASNPVNALGCRSVFSTRDAEERPHQPVAIHPVQRELVDRDHATEPDADGQQAEKRQQILGQRRADRMRFFLKQVELVNPLQQHAVGVRDEHDQQHRDGRGGDEQRERW